jgi:hypothetical protein
MILESLNNDIMASFPQSWTPIFLNQHGGQEDDLILSVKIFRIVPENFSFLVILHKERRNIGEMFQEVKTILVT